MNIIGIGIDGIEISRFKSIENNNNFLERVFTQKEIEYCKQKTNSAESFAVRFAGKEAVIKATTKIKKFLPEQIEILNGFDGSPVAKILDKNFPKDIEILVSLSHSETIATAISIIQI